MSKEKISVIIPVYNVENYVERCVTSVVDQTYNNLEIILVDDGSTDGSGELCDKMAGADSRIRVIHKENGGLSDARNVGMDAATGSYIGFVDSDDWIDSDMYEVLFKLMVEHNVEVSGCRFRGVYANWIDDESTGQVKVYDKWSALRAILMKEDNFYPSHTVWNKLYKKELLDNFRFIKGMLVEDLYFTPKVIFASNGFVFINAAKYNYLQERPESIMNAPLNFKRMDDELNAYKETAEFLDSLNMEDASLVMKQEFLKKLMEFQVEIKNSDVRDKAELLRSFRGEFSGSPYRKLKGKMDSKTKLLINLFGISPNLYAHARNFHKSIKVMRKAGIRKAAF